MADTMTEPDRLRVKRDGPRGWHWIAAANFDPTKHEMMDTPPPAAPATQAPASKRGRKHQPTEATHGDR